MKRIILLATVSSFLLACSSNDSPDPEGGQANDSSQTTTVKKDTSKKSIPSETKKWIGNTDIKINYHSPGVRGRTIWGGLVATMQFG